MESQTANRLAPTARVWIYVANRLFTNAERLSMEQQLEQFAQGWSAHQNRLIAYGGVVANQAVVLMVDEQQMGASGCSIDSSVRFIQALETQYNLTLLDRQLVIYRAADGSQQTASLADFRRLYAAGDITNETVILDALVNTNAGLQNELWKSVADSWLSRIL